MDKQAQANLRTLLCELLGMPAKSVRPGDLNQPNEGDNYAIVRITSLRHLGWSDGDSGAIKQLSEAELTIDFFGESSLMHASRLHLALQSRIGLDQMTRMGVGYLGSSTVLNLTELELERVRRYQVVLTLSLMTNYDAAEENGGGEFKEIIINLLAEQ